MSDPPRATAPSANEIEQWFRAPIVQAGRPVLWTSLALLQFVRRFGWHAQFDCPIDGLDQPLVFAANHRSHADTAAILGTLPRSIRRHTAVAAALDVFGPDEHNGLKRRLGKECLQWITASGFHAFAFDRHGPPLRSVRTSVNLIRRGWNLLLYPEGTRSRTGTMTEFKAGVGVLAKFTGRPVIPVFVDGGETILPYGTFLPKAGGAIVRYGSPMWYRTDDTPATFTSRLHEAVSRMGHRQARAAAKLAYFRLRRQPA